MAGDRIIALHTSINLDTTRTYALRAKTHAIERFFERSTPEKSPNCVSPDDDSGVMPGGNPWGQKFLSNRGLHASQGRADEKP